MKANDLILPAAVVVGGYILVRGIQGFPNLSGIGDWLSNLFNFQKQTGWVTLAKDSMSRTETNTIAGTGLLASTPILYGWKEIGYQQQLMTQSNGEFYFEFAIASSTPSGYHTLYLDQRPWGGGYGERRLLITG